MPDVLYSGPVPAVTDWFVLVSPAYPFGEIKFYPAKQNGLTATLPHQRYNIIGRDDVPWRTGSLCLETSAYAFGRRAFSIEPYEAHKRLAWHIHRACQWLEDASRGTLFQPGDPFELPDYPVDESFPFSVAFSESSDSHSVWSEISDRVGIVEFFVLQRKLSLHIVRSFLTLKGTKILATAWGRAITAEAGLISRGIWLRLTDTPTLDPWQAPTTWGEMRAVCKEQGIDLDSLMHAALSAFRKEDEMGRIALIGSPIPARFSEQPERIHWLAIRTPELVVRDGQARGFRPGKQGGWYHNRERMLRDSVPVKWLRSENWHNDQLTTRGVLPLAVISRKILLLGAGALGSAIAELLVRGGACNLLVVDDDRFKAGNLVRHVLNLNDLNENKAAALAKRLNQISPHGMIEAINAAFPPDRISERARLSECDLVIDCTGNDEVVHHLSLFDWNSETLFFSVSMSLGARRLYCFSAHCKVFPLDAFRQQVGPWLAKDIEEQSDREMPREGIGCWHPVFPARADDVWLLASVAIKQLERVILSPLSEPTLIVFEQFHAENNFFSGVRLASIEAHNG
ncbi:MAG: ThiF family adenylyltransferase [Acidobacteria bacterium]|nr:ThiF family adenylyltransferase [Acidobacteriota bacterium]